MKYLFLFGIINFLLSCNLGTEKNEKKEITVSSPVSVNTDSIPPEFTITGIPRFAWRWHDLSGENYLILSDQLDTTREEFTNLLHAALYAFKDADFSLIWGKVDTVERCEFDITSEFIKDATSITDLDKDGVAEVTIMTRLACRSDVSPAVTKLLMYEGKTLYTLNGYSWVRSSMEDSFTVRESDVNLETLQGYKHTEEEYLKTYGRYKSEKDFASAPPEFLQYARKQWMKFVKEKEPTE